MSHASASPTRSFPRAVLWVGCAFVVAVSSGPARAALFDELVLKGRVVGPQGSAAAGATVEVGVDPGPSSAGFEPSMRTVCDAEGRYRLVWDGGAGRVALRARLAELRSEPRRWIDATAGARTLEALVLREEPTLRGVVRDPDGALVPGARVTVVRSADPTLRWGDRQEEVDADREGRFSLAWGPEAEAGIWAEAEGLVSPGERFVDESMRDRVVELELVRTATVSGLVEDSQGRPVEGALVSWIVTRLEIGHAIKTLPGDRAQWARTGPDGFFELRGVPAEELRVCATSPRSDLSHGVVDLEAGQTGWLKLVVEPLPTWTGRILDAGTGEGIHEVSLSGLTSSDPLGCFELKKIALGELCYFDEQFLFLLTHPRYATTTLRVPFNSRSTELSIRMLPRAILRGLVLDGEGRPLAGRLVDSSTRVFHLWETTGRTEHPSSSCDFTDLHGRFELELFPGEPCTVVAYFDGAHAILREIEVAAGGVAEQVFREPRAFEQRVRLVGRDGRPVVAARVTVHEDEGPWIQLGELQTGDDGGFRIPAAPGERLWVCVTRDGRRPEWLRLSLLDAEADPSAGPSILVCAPAAKELAEVSAVAGPELVLQIPERPARRLRGHILTVEGDAAPDRWVTVRCLGTALERQLFDLRELPSGEDGEFEFASLPPLPLELVVHGRPDGLAVPPPSRHVLAASVEEGQWQAPGAR